MVDLRKIAKQNKEKKAREAGERRVKNRDLWRKILQVSDREKTLKEREERLVKQGAEKKRLELAKQPPEE